MLRRVVEGVARGVLDAADGVLRLALDLVGLAFGLKLGVAGDLAGGFLDGTLGLIGRAVDPILVHNMLLAEVEFGQKTPRSHRSSGNSTAINFDIERNPLHARSNPKFAAHLSFFFF